MLAAEGSQSQHIDLEYHLQQASKSFYANRWILLDRSVSISKRFNAVVSFAACFMFIFENYADPSLDRHRRLIGMRPGTRFFIYGMNGLEVLLQMPASTHGLAKITGIWQNMLPVCVSIGGFNVCSPGILLALDVWGATKHLGFKT